jgi:hypothetical protein
MSDTKRDPLLSDDDLGYVKDTHTPEQTFRPMSNTPHTYTRQLLGKWHAGFQIGNQSFVLSCFDGTEEEAEWYAKMMDKAFAAALAKDAELIQQLMDELRILRIEFGNRVGQTTQIGIASLDAAQAAGFNPSIPTN